MITDEFGFIDKIRSHFEAPYGVTGIGDDCAVIPQKDGVDTLISSDLLVDGVHFLIEDISPEDLGWKAAAVNFSDIAAMGGYPEATFLSIALPPGIESGWMDRFIEGYMALSDNFNAPILGGDTSSSPDRLFINVTVLGSCPHGRSLRRSGAKAGDIICTSGPLGDSAAGLGIILSHRQTHQGQSWRADKATFIGTREQYFIDRHYRPKPRISEGRLLAECCGVHAMMDISDGLGSDLQHILKASSKGAVVDCSRIPISEELRKYCIQEVLDPLDFAIDGGEDYELLFTVDPEAEKTLPIPHFVIGRITKKESLVWDGSNKRHEGFRHF